MWCKNLVHQCCPVQDEIYFHKACFYILRHVFVDLLSLDASKTFYKPDWFDIVGAEVKCCKEAVCVIDMSSFTKFELTVSRDALWLLRVNQHQIIGQEDCIHCKLHKYRHAFPELNPLVCPHVPVNRRPGAGGAAASVCQRPGCSCGTHCPYWHAE